MDSEAKPQELPPPTSEKTPERMPVDNDTAVALANYFHGGFEESLKTISAVLDQFQMTETDLQMTGLINLARTEGILRVEELIKNLRTKKEVCVELFNPERPLDGWTLSFSEEDKPEPEEPKEGVIPAEKIPQELKSALQHEFSNPISQLGVVELLTKRSKNAEVRKEAETVHKLVLKANDVLRPLGRGKNMQLVTDSLKKTSPLYAPESQ